MCPLKSELPKLNLDILIVDALTIAEYEFSDTIRIKIGFDKGFNIQKSIFSIEWLRIF